MTMNAMQARIAALAEQQKAQGQDLNEAKASMDFPVAAEGPCRLRLIQYLELGVHTTEVIKGQPKTKPRARWVFEVSGPKHPAIEAGDKKFLHTVKIEEPIGFGEKNWYMRLFAAMKKDYPHATTFYELVDGTFRGRLYHSKSKDGKRTYVNLKTKGKPYSVESRFYEDEDTGDIKESVAAPRMADLLVFPWDFATLEDWDAVYIDGKYDNGGTKNHIQETLKRAENFVGSPVYIALMEAGREADTIPDPTFRQFGAAAGDNPDEGESDEGADKPINKPGEPKQAPKPTETKKALEAEDGDDPLAGM